MADRPTIAVLGTGIMGSAMAGRWAQAGFPLAVWNRHRSKAEGVAAPGARVAATPAEAVAGADVVVTMLADGDATVAVMKQARPSINGDTLWLQMGTVGIVATDRLAAMAAAPPPLRFVDAPVTGTRAPAQRGELVVLASGPESVRDQCA